MQTDVIAQGKLLPTISKQPGNFEFFQAVRLLQYNQQFSDSTSSGDYANPVGYNNNPQQEIIRFRSLAALRFPASAIEHIQFKQQLPYSITVTFMGLTGPSGVLPDHYTELLIERLAGKDRALRDFFDLFNHRIISLFYRAWEKYRFYIGYEHAQHSNKSSDNFGTILASLMGLGTKGLASRLPVSDDALFYYGGYFSQTNRSSIGLENILCGYFKLPVQVQQFHGTWLQLDKQSCSRLDGQIGFKKSYAQLGVSTVLGQRVWDVQSKFRLMIGPLSYAQFCELLPIGSMLKPLVRITEFYAGIALSFDIQLILKANEVPFCSLSHEMPRRLGWNSWLKSRPFPHDAKSVITQFDCYGVIKSSLCQ